MKNVNPNYILLRNEYHASTHKNHCKILNNNNDKIKNTNSNEAIAYLQNFFK